MHDSRIVSQWVKSTGIISRPRVRKIWKNKFIHKVRLGNCDKSVFHQPERATSRTFKPMRGGEPWWGSNEGSRDNFTVQRVTVVCFWWRVSSKPLSCLSLSQTQTLQTPRNEDPPYSLDYSGSGSGRDQEGRGCSGPDQRQLRWGPGEQWVCPGGVLCPVVRTLQR